jgi:hypothetical protein
MKQGGNGRGILRPGSAYSDAIHETLKGVPRERYALAAGFVSPQSNRDIRARGMYSEVGARCSFCHGLLLLTVVATLGVRTDCIHGERQEIGFNTVGNSCYLKATGSD